MELHVWDVVQALLYRCCCRHLAGESACGRVSDEASPSLRVQP